MVGPRRIRWTGVNQTCEKSTILLKLCVQLDHLSHGETGKLADAGTKKGFCVGVDTDHGAGVQQADIQCLKALPRSNRNDLSQRIFELSRTGVVGHKGTDDRVHYIVAAAIN